MVVSRTTVINRTVRLNKNKASTKSTGAIMPYLTDNGSNGLA
jgi:hypothetical protein